MQNFISLLAALELFEQLFAEYKPSFTCGVQGV